MIDKYLKVFHKFKPDIIKALLETLDMMFSNDIDGRIRLDIGYYFIFYKRKGILSNRLRYILSFQEW